MKNYKFIKSWECPKPIKKFIISKLDPDKTLNLCCGAWPFACVNVDLSLRGSNIQGGKIIKADILKSEFDLKNRFDFVFCDPPYNWPYQMRAALNRAAANHLKKGGLFILNAPWPPRAFYFEILEVYVIFKSGGLPANANLISIAKYTGQEAR